VAAAARWPGQSADLPTSSAGAPIGGYARPCGYVSESAGPGELSDKQIADSARVRSLAKRVAGGAPITSLCAWLGLRLRGRNLRPVSREIGTSLWADSRSPVGGQVVFESAVG
jgi:hypothetical protein